LHHSQKKTSKTKDGILYEYKLIPNYELVQAILRLGDQVKVIEPIHLKQEIKELLLQSLNAYKN
jgi:predicted DNA-binding transcriptional regulator YafY